MTRIRLPRRDGTLHDYTLRGPSPWKLPAPGTRLIAGDEFGYSDALLGIFDPIAPAATAALAALAAGDRKGFDEILGPTVPLSRHIFCAPTHYYKTGVVFLAWLNGRQKHFVMIAGEQSARNLLHFVELFRLADAAGVLVDAELACVRMRTLLALHGVES